MLLNMFRRVKPQTTTSKDISCRDSGSDEEEESSALIAHSARYQSSFYFIIIIYPMQSSIMFLGNWKDHM